MAGAEANDTDENADKFHIRDVDLCLKSSIDGHTMNIENYHDDRESENNENSCDKNMETPSTGDRLIDSPRNAESAVKDSISCLPKLSDITLSNVVLEVNAEECYIEGSDWTKVDLEKFTILPQKVPHSDGVSNKKIKSKRKCAMKEVSKSEKKKKWKNLSLDDVGIYPTLFPRAIVPVASPGMMQEYDMFVEADFNQVEEKITKKSDFELYEALTVKRIRADRHQRVRKAGKQVKDKYCRSVKNNNGKRLFVHHRIFKLMHLAPQRLHFMPKPKPKDRNAIKLTRAKSHSTIGKNAKLKNAPDRPQPPSAVETQHALHSQNLSSFIASEQGLADLLISLQHRDLSPEDYELLLRLDEQVAPKTVSNKTLSQFKTQQAQEADCVEHCAICMEIYSMGQEMKYLPCEHRFHTTCIDMWLQNSSPNCPLDGLPLDQ